MGWHHRAMTTQTALETPYVIPTWTLGDRIRKARHQSGLSQIEFAKLLEVTASRIASWETDAARPRDVVAIARRIELLTGIPAHWTLGLGAEHLRPGPTGGDPVTAGYGSAQVTDLTEYRRERAVGTGTDGEGAA